MSKFSGVIESVTAAGSRTGGVVVGGGVVAGGFGLGVVEPDPPPIGFLDIAVAEADKRLVNRTAVRTLVVLFVFFIPPRSDLGRATKGCLDLFPRLLAEKFLFQKN